MQNINEMTYGIEIECIAPINLVNTFGYFSYSYGVQIPGLPTGWKVKTDCSIVTSRRNHVGIEIVSPRLQGADGIRQIKLVCDWLAENGVRTNPSCGFHVHVGFDRRNMKTLTKLVRLFARNELGFFAATGTKNRMSSRYCRPIKDNPDYVAKFRDKSDPSLLLGNRYLTLNLVSQHPTVEFRVFQGTTSFLKIASYLRLCLGCVEKASNMKGEPKWDQPANTKRRKGEGAGAVSFLIKDLGWLYNNSKNFGDLQADEMPSLKETIQELNRLGKKFDAA